MMHKCGRKESQTSAATQQTCSVAKKRGGYNAANTIRPFDDTCINEKEPRVMYTRLRITKTKLAERRFSFFPLVIRILHQSLCLTVYLILYVFQVALTSC